jgi:hypothetical protein
MMTNAVTRADRARPRRRQRWLERDDWRKRPGGNLRLSLMGYRVVTFMKYRPGRIGVSWQSRVEHVATGEKLFSRYRDTCDEARLSAFDLIREMYAAGFEP